LRTRRVDLDAGTAKAVPYVGRDRELDAVVRAGGLAVLELRLRDGGSEVDVPQRRRFHLVREPALEEMQERQLRDALGALADRRVGHRPVDGQTEMLPQILESPLVLERQ